MPKLKIVKYNISQIKKDFENILKSEEYKKSMNACWAKFVIDNELNLDEAINNLSNNNKASLKMFLDFDYAIEQNTVNSFLNVNNVTNNIK